MFDSYIVSNTKTSLSMPLCRINVKLKNKKNLKHFAFTLAETLITLTIIGVIAALTVPSLISEYRKHSYVVGLKKAYSHLQNAVKMIPITEGCSAGDYDCAGLFQGGYQTITGEWVGIPVTNIDGIDFKNNSGFKRAYLFSKQFKIKELCHDSACLNNIPLTSMGFISDNAAVFTTQDGMNIAFEQGSSFGVDVNGTKGPNKVGRDVFYFDIAAEYRNGINQGILMPSGSKTRATYYNDDNIYWRTNKKCSTENANKTGMWERTAKYCTGRVLEEDAMNY